MKRFAKIAVVLLALCCVGAMTYLPHRRGAFRASGSAELTYTTGLTIWHKADAISASDGDEITSWVDSSGNQYNASQVTANVKPRYLANTINGLPSVAFDDTDFMYLSNVLSGFTAGEIFTVLSVTNDPPAGNQVVYLIGTLNSLYPYSDGHTWDGFGSSTRKYGGDPATDLTQWNIYNVSSTTTWTNRFNGVDHFGATGNTVAFPTGPRIGGSLSGKIAEMLIYDHVLTAANRTTVNDYLDAKYALPNYP